MLVYTNMYLLATGIVDIQYAIYLVVLHLSCHLYLPQIIDSIRYKLITWFLMWLCKCKFCLVFFIIQCYVFLCNGFNCMFADHWFSGIAAFASLASATLSNANSAENPYFTYYSTYLVELQNISLHPNCSYAFAFCIVIKYNRYLGCCYIT